MQPTLEKAFFALIRSGINGEGLCEDEKKLINSISLFDLFKVSKRHDLAHLIANGLKTNGFLVGESEGKAHFLQERNMAVYRRETQRYVLHQICDTLEEAKIPYLPLKGSVLCTLYPEAWMRTSCDIDILVQKADIDKAVELLKEKGYRFEGDHYHDISLYSEEGVHLELHYGLIEERDSLECHALLEDIWSQLLPVGGRDYEYRMPEELFFFYHIAHTAKHFVYGGCGIRPFLDIWIMQREMPYDTEKFQSLLQKGGLQTFYEYAIKLIEHWFEGAEADDTTQKMQAYVFRGGVYGTEENRVAVNREHPKGKWGYLLSSVFVSYENLWRTYPALKGRKWLTPVYQVRRWFRILFKGMSKAKRNTLRTYDTVSKEQKEETKLLLEQLNLCQNEGKGF